MSQNEGRDVPFAEALGSYVDEVLRHRRDEATVIAPVTENITVPIDIIDEDDWRLKV